MLIKRHKRSKRNYTAAHARAMQHVINETWESLMEKEVIYVNGNRLELRRFKKFSGGNE